MLSLNSVIALSQNQESFKFINKNTVQLELGGPGIFYSAIYERFIINQHRLKTNLNIGLSYYGEKADVLATSAAHSSVNQLFSISKSHHIELGGGILFFKENQSNLSEELKEKDYSIYPTARVGYRYQKPDGKLLIRAACTPIAEFLEKDGIHLWPSLAVGYSF